MENNFNQEFVNQFIENAIVRNMRQDQRGSRYGDIGRFWSNIPDSVNISREDGNGRDSNLVFNMNTLSFETNINSEEMSSEDASLTEMRARIADSLRSDWAINSELRRALGETSLREELDGDFILEGTLSDHNRSEPAGTIDRGTMSHVRSEYDMGNRDFSTSDMAPEEDDDHAEIFEENKELEALNVKLRQALVFAIRMADNAEYVKSMVEDSFEDILA